MMGWDTALYLMIASFVISAAFAPKVQAPAPAALGEFEFPQADEGTAQAVIFGDCWSSDWTVLAVGNYRSTAIRSSGGKK